MNYGYAPAGFAPGRQGGYSPMVLVGADAAAEPSFIDKAKTFLDTENSIVHVKNGYLVAGAAVIGAGIYFGWFGKRRRR